VQRKKTDEAQCSVNAAGVSYPSHEYGEVPDEPGEKAISANAGGCELGKTESGGDLSVFHSRDPGALGGAGAKSFGDGLLEVVRQSRLTMPKTSSPSGACCAVERSMTHRTNRRHR
jgi:hypothetical protein